MTTKSELPKIPGVPDLSKVTTVAQAAKGARIAMQRTTAAKTEIYSRFAVYLTGCVETGYWARHLKRLVKARGEKDKAQRVSWEKYVEENDPIGVGVDQVDRLIQAAELHEQGKLDMTSRSLTAALNNPLALPAPEPEPARSDAAIQSPNAPDAAIQSGPEHQPAGPPPPAAEPDVRPGHLQQRERDAEIPPPTAPQPPPAPQPPEPPPAPPPAANGGTEPPADKNAAAAARRAKRNARLGTGATSKPKPVSQRERLDAMIGGILADEGDWCFDEDGHLAIDEETGEPESLFVDFAGLMKLPVEEQDRQKRLLDQWSDVEILYWRNKPKEKK